MKKSVKFQIIGTIILIILAVVDAFSVFVPIVAIAFLAIILFKPMWFFNFIKNIYSNE